MKRRSFLSALAAISFVGSLVPIQSNEAKVTSLQRWSINRDDLRDRMRSHVVAFTREVHRRGGTFHAVQQGEITTVKVVVDGYSYFHRIPSSITDYPDHKEIAKHNATQIVGGLHEVAMQDLFNDQFSTDLVRTEPVDLNRLSLEIRARMKELGLEP